MPGAFDLIGTLARFVHISSACLLTGVFAFLVFVSWPARRAGGPAAHERCLALDRRLLTLGTGAIVVALVTGVVDLARQAVVATGGATDSFVPQAIGALLSETRYGDVWLGRHMLWLLLGVLLVLRDPERGPADRMALRLAGLVIAAAGLVAGAAAGHAASAPSRIALSIAVDALHLLATGVWVGALLPLALLLREASADRPDALSPLAAAVAVQRFSIMGLVGVTAMVATGTYAVLQQVGSVPALLGTAYGRWLVLKLALLVPLFSLALLNRAVLRPLLERALTNREERERTARVPLARLRRFVLLEALLAAAVLGAVAVLGLTTPARHDPISWPLPFRVDWDLTIDLPGVRRQVIAGAAIAAIGVTTAVALVALRRRWWRPALLGGALALGLGLAMAVPPIAVDAYPTTYRRPEVPYTAASIVRGETLYGEHCSRCHGAGSAGDRALTASAPRISTDLIGRRTTERTAGDLFWWVSHHDPASGTTAPPLGPQQRWDVVNFLRTLSAAEAARDLTATVTAKPVVVAPDVRYTTGVAGERALRDHRGQTIVLLVFFSLPESLERLLRISRASFDLRVLGVEVIAVPLEGARTLYRTLGAQPLLFPFVIDGAEEAVAAYRHLQPARPTHVEMVIDRRGYLRGRWIPAAAPHAPGGWNDVNTLLRELTRLAGEPRSAPILGEHIH
jgi:putative copper resistance protein D